MISKVKASIERTMHYYVVCMRGGKYSKIDVVSNVSHSCKYEYLLPILYHLLAVYFCVTKGKSAGNGETSKKIYLSLRV